MFGSEILDVAIGLALVFLFLSLIASAIREGLEAWFKTRALFLERGIRELLGAQDLATALYKHPLIAALYPDSYSPRTSVWERTKRWWGKHNLPAYVPSKSFATALLDIVVRGSSITDASVRSGGPRISVSQVRQSLPALGSPHVQRAILSAIDLADGDMTKAQANVEAWFNSAMDRVSGWYKRRTQATLVVIGFVLAVTMNVNAFTIARYLYRDKGARDAIVARAQQVSRDSSILKQTSIDTITRRLDELSLPIGWHEYTLTGTRRDATLPDTSAWALFRRDAATSSTLPAIFGWLVVAFAVSLGAPFWFDLLNKFMVIRSTVKPHEKSPEEGSEDRQDKPAGPAGANAAAGARAPAAGADREAPPAPDELRRRLAQTPSVPVPDSTP